MQRLNKVFGATAVLVLTVALGTASASYRDTVEKRFSVQPGGTFVLTADFGSIEVRTHSANAVDIKIFRKVDTGSKRRAKEILEGLDIQYDQRGNTVEMEVHYPDSWEERFRRDRLHLRFRITVPREFNVDLKTGGGSIAVDDLKGEVRGRTSGGGLTFGRIEGPIYGRTSGGAIRLESCTGNAEVRTSGGSIHIGDVTGNVIARTSGGGITILRTGGEVEAETSGGNIRVEDARGAVDASTSGGSIRVTLSAQPQRDCRFRTSGGSIYVYLPEDVRVSVDASTGSGHVETDFPIILKGRIDERAFRAKINGGGPLLRLRTTGGNIYLRKL